MSELSVILNEAFIIIVNDAGTIKKTSSGVSRTLKKSPRELIDKNLIEILSPQSQFLLTEIIVNSLTGAELSTQPVFLFTSSRVALGFEVEGKSVEIDYELYDDTDEYDDDDSNILYSLKFKYDEALTKMASPLNHKDGFTKGASAIIRESEHKLDMTFVSIGDVKNLDKVEGLTTEQQEEFIEKIEEKLRVESLDGAASCQLDDGKYALIHKSDSNFEKVEAEIAEWAKSIDPKGQVIKVQTKSIDLDSEELSDRELKNAINHATEVFTGGDINDVIFDTLNESSIAYIDHALNRKQLLIEALENSQLTAVYSAVVEMQNWHCVHLWTKIRADFETDGLGTSEIRRLIEDDPELQTRVDADQCRIIDANDWSTEHSVSLDFNLHSLDDISIIEKLLLIRRSMNSAKLVIRISGIDAKNISRLSSLRTLQRAGLTIGLYGDELGAINPSLLKNLPIDFIIVEFEYTRNPESLQMAMPMLRSLHMLCKENGIKLIFKGIESYETATILSQLNDVIATGRYFGSSVEDPDQLDYKASTSLQPTEPEEIDLSLVFKN